MLGGNQEACIMSSEVKCEDFDGLSDVGVVMGDGDASPLDGGVLGGIPSTSGGVDSVKGDSGGFDAASGTISKESERPVKEFDLSKFTSEGILTLILPCNDRRDLLVRCDPCRRIFVGMEGWMNHKMKKDDCRPVGAAVGEALANCAKHMRVVVLGMMTSKLQTFN